MSTTRAPKSIYADFPRFPDGKRLDKKKVKELYDKSEHLSWTTFAATMDWDPYLAWRYFQHKTWQAEKRGRIQARVSDAFDDFTITFKEKWLKDVRNTLTNYPRAVDSAMSLIFKWMKQQSELERAPSISSLAMLAAALKTCTETKRQLLLIQDKVADVKILPPSGQGEAEVGNEWKLEVMGGEALTQKEIVELMVSYIDKPTAEVVPEAEFADAQA